MASFNRVMLLGNLTRDPAMKYLPNQTAVTEFGLACNRKFKASSGEMRDETTFVDCSAFGRVAEIINQYCTKGKPIFIEGRLKFDSWEDKNGGGKRSKLSVVVETMQLLGGREGGPGGGGGGAEGGYDQDEGGHASPPPPPRAPNRAAPPPPRPRQAAPPPPAEPPFGEEEQFKEDDIPF